MKTLRLPTCIIVNEIMWNDPTTVHLSVDTFGTPPAKSC